jgi:hypothetical protein
MRTFLLILALTMPAMAGREFVAASSQQFTNNIPTVSATPITLAVWGRPTSLTISQLALGIASSTNGWRHELTFSGAVSGDPYRAISTTSSSAVAEAAPYSINQWQHLAGVFGSSTSRILSPNGLPAATNTTTRSIANFDTVTVGARYDSAALFFSGAIAEACIWSVALTADEVLSLSLGASPFFIRPASIIFYAPLTGNSTEPNIVGGPLVSVNSPDVSADHPRIYRP